MRRLNPIAGGSAVQLLAAASVFATQADTTRPSAA